MKPTVFSARVIVGLQNRSYWDRGWGEGGDGFLYWPECGEPADFALDSIPVNVLVVGLVRLIAKSAVCDSYPATPLVPDKHRGARQRRELACATVYCHTRWD